MKAFLITTMKLTNPPNECRTHGLCPSMERKPNEFVLVFFGEERTRRMLTALQEMCAYVLHW